MFESKTIVKRRIQMLVSRLPDTWMANESWGRETLAQNWGHYAKLCSRQKCISVFQIYHDGEKKASDMLLLSLGCVAALHTGQYDEILSHITSHWALPPLELVSKELNHLAAILHVLHVWFLWSKKKILSFFKKKREILLHF